MFRLVALAAAFLVFSLPALATEMSKAGDVGIEQPWARASAGRGANGAAYVTLTNHGQAPDKLIAASSPVASRAELHAHSMEGGIMKMRPVYAIEIAPGGQTVLQPGSMHIMLIGVHDPMKQGTTFPLTLTFEQGGAVTIDVPVEAAGALRPMGGHMKH